MRKLRNYLFGFVLICAQVIFISQPAAAAGGTPSPWAVNEIAAAQITWMPEGRLYDLYQNNITREEFAELVIKLYEALLGSQAPVPDTNPFTDTDLEHVLKANSLGIVEGIGNGKFNPGGLITRQDMATMYSRLLTALMISPVVTQEYVLFADEAQIGGYAKAPVQLMYKLGILKGSGGGVISPLDNATREQAIALSNRIYLKYKTPDFEKHGLEMNVEAGVTYDYVTECKENENINTVGAATITDYSVVASDAEHEAKEGYVWKFIEAQIVFSDSNALNYGYKWGCFLEDYYNTELFDAFYIESQDGGYDTFTVYHNGESRDCMGRYTNENSGWRDSASGGREVVITFAYEICVPEGYDGLVVGFRDRNIVWEDELFIWDVANENALFFRLT